MLDYPVILCPGDEISINYTGELGDREVSQEELISHKIEEGSEVRKYDHVAIYSFQDEFGMNDGIACILGSGSTEDG